MISLAYLVSQYPAVSHTFILREVRALRGLGFAVRVASVNAPDRPSAELTAEERAEAAATFVVKAQGALAILGAHLRTLLRRPVGYARGLVAALRLAGLDPRRLLYHGCYFAEAVVVGAWMARGGLRHLHVHFATPASTVALLASRIFPIDFSITVHGPDEFYDAPGFRLREKIAAARFLCCIGTYARSQLMHLSPVEHWDKIEVAPLGVDPCEFAPPPAAGSRPDFEILCVGRLVPAKGQHVLLAAVEELVREGRPVRLRLVGDGPDRAALERAVVARRLGAHVRFEGAVNQDGIRALYARADAFALASFAEGVPVVLMEAMAMGVPCVSTRITGIPELIRDRIDGLLVAPSDPGELAAALRRLMDDPELRQGLGRAGRDRVRAHYDLARNTKRLAEIYRRQLGGTAPVPVAATPIALASPASACGEMS